jgi:glucosamine--fructose-6-phosphate aminotransferase (isomerizing)
VAVASTKSYDAQVAVLALLSSAASGTFNAVKQLEVLQDGMKQLIARREEIHELAKTLVPARDAFYVGRGLDYDAALESALKLKEIAYVHAEAYPGGELKHGPIALIEKDTPVFGFVSDAVSAAAIRNNLIELEARGASVYVIASASLKENGDAFVVPDAKSCLSPILKVMFGQYLAYYLAVEKKLPIDKPRNLAKSVTVQ